MKQLSEMSLVKLKSQEKQQTTVLGAFIGLILIMAVAGVISTFQRGFTVFTVLPIAFLPLITVFSTNLKKTKAEIRSRNL
ncbi:hypothetical protein [Spirosoma arcticum]